MKKQFLAIMGVLLVLSVAVTGQWFLRFIPTPLFLIRDSPAVSSSQRKAAV